ncbi:geminin coiled-coil domain-containing protein 1 [Sardina pilchardus]|uniref:geminin coiled-coil domain-containing protein 1 n=1 Tax=Sardina pilchardus TaxID=27697 RepID=UPI002E101D06
MSTILSCQDLSFVGGQRYNCPYSVSTSADPSVDVSTDTLVSLWDARPRDNAACQQHEPPLRDLQHSDHGAVSLQTWPDHLSPQLQRNKQLQDTLMQREEELARLHDENNKLKEFLNSSFVKCLEEKRKKLLYGPSRHRKRRQQACAEERGPCGLVPDGVTKRTCRNLSLEFCSAEELATTPPLDSWVLETLGLKDQDTIDPESGFGSPTLDPTQPSFNPASSNPVSTSYISPSAHYSPPALGSTCDFSAIMDSSSSYSCSLQSSGSYAHDADPSSSHASSLSSASEFSSSVEMPLVYPHTPTVAPQALHPTGRLLSPDLSERLAPVAASTPQRSPQLQCSSSPRPAGGSSELCSPVQSRSDLAFSMLLSPRNSVRTHSFPQGQAFVRKDVQGGWNFTWVPKQCA